jgi:hypothetical protein
MGGRDAKLLAAIAVALLATAPGARAVDLEKLVMPGPVIEGHAEVEGDCRECHQPFAANEQGALCLECHEEVGADITASEGFHGQAPGAATAQCRDCHTEHQGRDADIVDLDRAGFDHTTTDFTLRDAHRLAACAACHPAGRSWREAPHDCFACHEREDSHAGALGTDCAACHVEQTWRTARFDHATTDFPLEGAHPDVDCALCHAGERYDGTPRDCRGCHAVDDAHRGRFGPDCQACHVSDHWKPSRFDHRRETRFPLTGRHARASCESCHRGPLYEQALDSRCVACHVADDVHRGRRGAECEQCHGTDDWTSMTFDHERATKFPLRGAHTEVSCERCHTGKLGEEKTPTTCDGCHGKDDPHGSQLGKDCAACHDEASWTKRVFFEHDIARFPLLGLHAVTACEQCHLTPRFRDVELSCFACHQDDDEHLGRLGPDCGRCHNPNGWNLWRFDHFTETGFRLEGGHETLTCHDCHRDPAGGSTGLPSSCHGCHASDDPHYGAFGRDCARCHRGTTWKNVDITN